MMMTADFAAFGAAARADGYEEILTRDWAPGQVIDTHAHPFALRVQVASGEVWLTWAGQTRRFGAGEGFELPRGEPHAERYGPEGAHFWVARRHGA